MDLFQELRDLTDTLVAHGIDYALCGGVALAIHGVPRATQDIDILVHPTDLERLRETVRTLGFTLESFPMDFSSGITVRRFIKLIGAQPLMLDALIVGPALEHAWAHKQVAEVEGGRVQVITREDLIALKLAAGRPRDLADVQQLNEAARG